MDKPKMVKTEEAVLTSSKFDITTSSEGGGEYAMPDYYPEIRRVVSVSASALPDTKFLSGDTLEYGGTLAFTVLYIGEDGALVSVPYACEYSGSQQLPAQVRGAGDIAVDVRSEAPQCRVLAPRRISLKSRLRIRINADETAYYTCRAVCEGEEGDSGADNKTVQQLTESVAVLTRGRAAGTGTVEGEIRERAGTKPLSCSGTVNITEVKCNKDCIQVRGEIIIRCLTFTADGIYAPVRSRLAFEECLEASGAEEGDRGRAWGRVASVSVSEAEDGSGVIQCEAEYDLEGEWCRRSRTSVVQDAYSSRWELAAERSDMNVLSPLCCTSSALSVSGSGRRTNKSVQNEYLIDMTAEPQVERAERQDGKTVFTGNCAIKALVAAEGEVAIEEFGVPFRYECTSEEAEPGGETVWSAFACCTDVSGRLEEDKIVCNAELCLSVSAQRKADMSPVTRMILKKSEARSDRGAEIKLYYPVRGETVWSIAKRYGAPIADIERLNGVQRSSEAEGKALVIPCLREC